MKTFTIIEHIPHGRTEFTFKGFRDLANKLRMFHDLFKIQKDKKYRVLIEEV